MFYINDLHVKRQKSNDVDSVNVEKEKDLTYLTFFKEGTVIVDLSYYHVVDGIITAAYPILMILPSPNHSTAFSNTC